MVLSRPWPHKTDADLKAAGYSFKNRGRCRSCQAEIEWWLTPKQKHMPLDAGTLQPHWASCSHAAQFRKRGTKKPWEVL